MLEDCRPRRQDTVALFLSVLHDTYRLMPEAICTCDRRLYATNGVCVNVTM